MTGFTHGAVGAFIGRLLPLPIALPVAFVSHFVLDTLPHYGVPHSHRNRYFWRIFTALGFMVAWDYLGYILLSRHDLAMLACGIVAASPDFVWVARVVRTRSFDLSEKKLWFNKWHASIQHEYPRGIYLELPIAATLGYLAWRFW